jgi:hypothetical protein
MPATGKFYLEPTFSYISDYSDFKQPPYNIGMNTL